MQDELRRQYLDTLPELVASLKSLVKDYRLGNKEVDE